MCGAFSSFCFLPSPPFAFHCVSVWRVPVLSRAWGLMAGLSGFASHLVRSPSWSWLPIVVAPGCLGCPTSTGECDEVVYDTIWHTDNLQVTLNETELPVITFRSDCVGSMLLRISLQNDSNLCKWSTTNMHSRKMVTSYKNDKKLNWSNTKGSINLL